MELEIVSSAFEGKSVGRVDNLVVFVPYAVPGDRVRARIVRKKKRYLEAVLEEVLVPSPHRITPRCKFFAVCGGCTLQNTAYEKQLQLKRDQVIELYDRIGGLGRVDVKPTLPSSAPFFYRNKMEFSFGTNRWLTRAEIESGEELQKGFALGLHIPGRYDKILDLDECFLQSPDSVKIVNSVRDFALEKGWEAYNSHRHAGYLRNLAIRTSASHDEVMVNLVTLEHIPQRVEELCLRLASQLDSITTLVNSVNRSRSPVAFGEEEFTYYGKGWIHETVGGLTFKIAPSTFFQPNSAQAGQLFSVISELSRIDPDDLVYDLFCGVGTIGLFLAEGAGRVIGVESHSESVLAARDNAESNGIQNCQFVEMDAKQALKGELVSTYGRPDVLILDPPRAGVHPEVCREILDLMPPKVIYSSCNPATQARDLAILTEKYSVIEVQPVDMFPQTYHIEVVTSLELR